MAQHLLSSGEIIHYQFKSLGQNHATKQVMERNPFATGTEIYEANYSFCRKYFFNLIVSESQQKVI